MTTLLQSAEDVAAEIVARLGTITIAQGAETDCGLVVFQGRRDVSEEMIPCSVVIEAEDTPDASRPGTLIDLAQRYVLFAYVPCDPLNPNLAAHKALRDLKRAIFRTPGEPERAWPRWGGKVRKVMYLGRDIGPRSDGAAFVLATIEISVEYVEDLANP